MLRESFSKSDCGQPNSAKGHISSFLSPNKVRKHEQVYYVYLLLAISFLYFSLKIYLAIRHINQNIF